MCEEWTKECKNKVIYLDGKPSPFIIYENGRVLNTQTGNWVYSYMNEKGRYVINLTYNGKQYHWKLARLIATAFIPNPNNYETVDHINGDRTDNRISNLEWVSWEENMRRYKEKLFIEKNGYTPDYIRILDKETVHEICKRLEKGEQGKIIAEDLGMSRTEISDIKNGKIWKEIVSQYNIPVGKKCVLTKEDVEEICVMLNDGMLIKDIAEIYEVNRDTIGKIKRRERWVEVTKGLLK